ncbi:MAG: 7-carboxy-7-deazaguanine synthase QueE [Candidatus Omnitrophica bacterium]|nr:7-carboxy-7-deazaguanine synthase QueE [Candidatus Omnitrophota bacterium]
MTADIIEIFSSIQGEGIFLGAKQIFVRFKRCNLTCAYCDEDLDRKARRYSPLELMKEVKALEGAKGPHHSISLTGGEPLLYAEFLRSFLKILRKNRNFRSYLETNGTLPYELAKVIDLVDIVAMDFKLPSSTGERPFWTEHLEFLKIASKKKVFVKAIVTPNTVKNDVEKAIDLIKRMKKNIPFVLQPATPVGPHDKDVPKDALVGFLEIGLKHELANIRVIPQIHKILNMK